ncbi:2121a4ce-0610-4903-af75-060d14452285 [Thermothielavioides terrestris]|uniref:Ubiquitin 3 binding protein But2 C-terminal domain-containing protein n=2 Tax=Thermothielavioides terrestris TaxID=2587410 RepID=G2RFL2_THETT|nr:uncharacterized protein THITE_2122015 [Thermothielavioides terrestris NRRL 8126]AEO70495.1 hypothetical protein THITE_2122015 [Thermothielavioides terrestris NRRL 8126]SPQ18323.1 2121a4ce-0610-4903-af75-060d14452285 [Thermothielavioides terrestris]
MKFQAFALSLLAASGLASPVPQDVRQPLYTLRLSSPVPALDGAYLTLSPKNATQVGVYPPASAEDAQIRFHAVQDPATGRAELRTTNIPTTGMRGTVLALVGGGLLDLASLQDPAAVPVPAGGVCDWTSFRLGDGEGEGKRIVYVGKDGQAAGTWVAFPDGEAGAGWSVKWKDDNAVTTENYMPVQLVYEPVQDSE